MAAKPIEMKARRNRRIMISVKYRNSSEAEENENIGGIGINAISGEASASLMAAIWREMVINVVKAAI